MKRYEEPYIEIIDYLTLEDTALDIVSGDDDGGGDDGDFGFLI